MQATRIVAEFIADTGYSDLPPGLVGELRIALLDTLAAAFVGSTLPWARRVIEMVHELGGVPQAAVVNQPWQTDVSRAALANGAMIGAFECEPLTGSHACGTVLPAALAVSQRDRSNGKGSPHAPLSWDDACEKFGRYTAGIIAERQARAIIDAVAHLEDQDDMSRIAMLAAKA